MPDNKFTVGLSIVVVPDGLELVKGEWHCRLSLAMAPDVKATGMNKTIDIRDWPCEIANISKRLAIIVSTNKTDPQLTTGKYFTDSDCLKPDVDLCQFAEKSSELWKRIFTDGSVTSDSGFLALIDSFKNPDTEPEKCSKSEDCDCPDGNEDHNLPASHTAELGHTFDMIIGSALATSLVHRVAKHTLLDLGHTSHVSEIAFWEASRPGKGWWETLREDWLSNNVSEDGGARFAFRRLQGSPSGGPRVRTVSGMGQDRPRPRHARDPSVRTSRVARDAREFFFDHIGDLHFWNTGQSSQDSFPSRSARQRFKDHFNRHFKLFATADTQQGVADKSGIAHQKEHAARKYAGILAYPTLSKYLGLIVDVKVPVAFLLQGSDRARTHNLVSVLAIPDNTTVAKLIEHAQPAANATEIWTAYMIRRSSDCAKYEYFGPCEQVESLEIESSAESPSTPPAGRLFSDGILNLGVELPKSKNGRFKVQTIDVTNTVIQFKTAMDASPETTQEFPELRTRGISLIDTATSEDGVQSLVPAVPSTESQRNSPAPTIRIMYASDLITGYCIDVALATKKCIWRKKERWRTLTGRSLDFRRDADRQFMALSSVRLARVRDDGFVRPTQRQDSDNKLVLSSELFNWTGESLGIPHMSEGFFQDGPCQKAQNGLEIYPDPSKDLAVDLVYSLPSDPYRQPCPLRENRRYMFGLRIRFLNGCTVPFSDAVTRYISGKELLTLGENNKESYVFRRREKCHAPEVLLPWNERLVTSKVPGEIKGESIREMVIRSGAFGTDTSRRFVIPPRTTFDLSEQFGSFDSVSEPTPSGAFSGKFRVQLDHTRGIFPSARSGHWAFPESAPSQGNKPKKVGKQKPAKIQTPARIESRGLVLVADSAAKIPQIRYYPDPLGRKFFTRFQGESNAESTFGSMCDPIEFWSPTESAKDALPVLLELKKGKRGENGAYHGWFDLQDNSSDILPMNSSQKTSLKKLSIVLLPGETIDLEIYSMPDVNKLLECNHLAGVAMKLLRGSYRDGDITNVKVMKLPLSAKYRFQRALYSLIHGSNEDRHCLLQELLKLGTLPPIMSREVVTLTHAVDKPGTPKFAWDDVVGGKPRIFPVVLTVKVPNALDGVPKGSDSLSPTGDINAVPQTVTVNTPAQLTWEEYVRKQENPEKPLNRRHWPSAEGGTTTFFVGEVEIDRRTTGRIRCDAEWNEYGPQITVKDPKNGWMVKAPKQHAQLFAVDDISLVENSLGQTLDLARIDKTHRLRGLAHSFVDGRARRLHLRLIVTSRFSKYFPDETPREQKLRETTGVGKYEQGSTDALHTRAYAWSPCTFRPYTPQIDKILPVFHWATEEHEGASQIRWKRESSMRLFLGPSWFSSGEGECLGVVCWPPNLLSRYPGDEAEAASVISRLKIESLDANANLMKYGRFITRWGADPIQLSGGLEDFMSADRFRATENIQKVNETLSGKPLLLYLPESDPTAEDQEHKIAPTPVCLLAYEPKLDSHDGGWFVDIMIDPGPSYFPFVQLGLVRYQAHSADGLELSYPIATTVQIPPSRQGKIEFVNDHQFTFELGGIGYRQTDPGENFKGAHARTDFPFLKLTLLKAIDMGVAQDRSHGVNWQPVLDSAGRPIEICELRPRQRGAELVWTQDFSLPTKRSKVRYGLLMEEFELRARDRVFRDNAQKFGDIYFTTELKPRGPMFSHIVDLGVPNN